MTVREIDVAKLYEELMAFDRYLEMMEPNNDGASPSGGPSSRPAGSRPVSGEVPAPNGVEPASEATVVTPGNDGGKEDVVKPQVAIRPLEGEKMAEVKQRVCTAVQSTIGLILILIAYSFLGAALLNFTESFQEETNFNELDHVKQSVIADIINVTRSASRHKRDINTTVDPFGAGSDVWQAVDELLTTYTSAKESLRPYSNSPGWSFWGALFYCGTVYTTVGYGNVYPLTIEGRVITILYGIIGIPLCLVVLMNLGKTFTHAIKYLWSFVRRFYYTGSFRRVRCMVPAGRLRMTLFQRFKYSIRQHSRWSRSRTGGFRRRDVAPPIEAPDDAKPALSDQEAADEEFVPYEVDDTFNLPPVVALLIAFIYMLLGSALYTAWETNWTYFDAFYFVFISLSTIGLGDVVPQHPKFFLLTAFYLFIGLALVAMVINVFMEVMNVSITKAADRVLSVNLTRQRLVIDEETVQKIVKHLQQSSPPSPSQKETGGFDFNSSASVKRRGSV